MAQMLLKDTKKNTLIGECDMGTFHGMLRVVGRPGSVRKCTDGRADPRGR
jgi:hypothetical protein